MMPFDIIYNALISQISVGHDPVTENDLQWSFIKSQ